MVTVPACACKPEERCFLVLWASWLILGKSPKLLGVACFLRKITACPLLLLLRAAKLLGSPWKHFSARRYCVNANYYSITISKMLFRS